MNQKSKRAFVFSLTLLTSICQEPYSISAKEVGWSVNDTTGWKSDQHTKTYFHYSEMQRQWAWELLGKYQFNGSEKVLDFGSGDGKISASIASHAYNGKVVGVDISQSMLLFAKRRFPSTVHTNLSFELSSSFFANTLDNGSYDLVTAFCVFHIVPDPKTALEGIRSKLKPGGKLYLVTPAGRYPEFFQAAEETFEKFEMKAPWKRDAAPAPSLMRSVEGTKEILKASGFAVGYIQLISTPSIFYGRDELLQHFIGTTSANWDIPIELSHSFFDYLIARLELLDKGLVDSSGTYRIKIARIHTIAETTVD